ncbi:MAG: ATP-binding protein, partial [Chloroflexota bacterium]
VRRPSPNKRTFGGVLDHISREDHGRLPSLLSRGAVQGALTLLIRQNRPATTEDLRFLSSIGNQLGVALENARLFTKTQRRSQELNVINTVMQEITQTLALDDILERICEQTTRLMNAETFFVGLLNEEGDEIHAKVIVDKGERLEPFSFPMSDGNTLTSYIVATGESLLFYDLQAQRANLPAPGLIVGPAPHAWLGVPMMLEDRIIGAMSIQSYTPDRFTEADRRILSVIAGQTAIAISKARLFEELETRMKQLQDAQARLMQSEKMAALGALVSGVAHELNNPLTAVIGYAQLLQLRDLDDDIKRDLQRIYDGAQRSSQIANDLLTFARSYKPQRSPVDINQALQQTLALQAYEMRVHNTKIVTDLLPDLLMTMADPHRLKQVFLNLIVNAQQAMEGAKGGGILTVRTVRPPDRPGTIRIEFEDNGPGIPPEILGRIFDPFFTTKEVGKGTGLGLSICYGIITEHGGTIWAENNVERGKGAESGAIFIVDLPFVPVKEEKTEDEQSPGEVLQDKASLRLLVVVFVSLCLCG